MEKVSVQRGVRRERGHTSISRMARGLYFQGNERYGVCRHLDGWDSCLELMTFFFFPSHISERKEWTPNWGLDVYMCVSDCIFFSSRWYVVIQFSSCRTRNIRLLIRCARFFLAFSLRVKHSKRPESQMPRPDLLVLWYVEAHPIIKDAPIHIHDKNLVISEHPLFHTHTHTYTQARHTPQQPSWIFMSVVLQTKTLAVRGHYPLTQAAVCDGSDSGDATQDLFIGGCCSSVNTLISPFCWNTTWHHYELKWLPKGWKQLDDHEPAGSGAKGSAPE